MNDNKRFGFCAYPDGDDTDLIAMQNSGLSQEAARFLNACYQYGRAVIISGDGPDGHFSVTVSPNNPKGADSYE